MQWTIEGSRLGRVVVPPSLPAGFALLYTTLDFDGRLSGGTPALVTETIRERFGIETSLTTCKQVHGVSIEMAHEGSGWRECDSCDALWSREKGTTLGIKVADCLPITMIDDAHGVTLGIHSGWRGAVSNIATSSIDRVAKLTAFDVHAASAWLGPSIRVCCFEVGEEVVEAFRDVFPDADAYTDRSRGAKPHIDLPKLTASLLESRGIAGERIFDSGLCTRCDGSIFHSYRRQGPGGGRNLALVSQ